VKITVQVVGVFFYQEIDLPEDQEQVQVKDVLDACQRLAPAGRLTNVELFQYKLDKTAPTAMVHSFNVKYKGGFESRVKDASYPSGEYYLAQNTNARPAYSVWQYYIFDKDGRAVRDWKKVESFASPNATVPAGGKLVWRLLNILAGPNMPSMVDRQALAAM